MGSEYPDELAGSEGEVEDVVEGGEGGAVGGTLSSSTIFHFKNTTNTAAIGNNRNWVRIISIIKRVKGILKNSVPSGFFIIKYLFIPTLKK